MAHDEELRKIPPKDLRLSLVASLRACARAKDIRRGMRLHNDISKLGLIEKCSDALVAMYASCGDLAKAEEVLHMHSQKNVFAWTALIAGFTRQGKGRDALRCFDHMQSVGLSPDAVTLACLLKAAGSVKEVDKGWRIHSEIIKQDLLKNDIVLGNALVDMYAKCGALEKAHHTLNELPFRDVVSWSALITGYAQHGEGEKALDCYEQMLLEDLSPDAVTYICILKACGSLGDLNKGERIHEEIKKKGFVKKNLMLGNALIDMYAKCGALTKAKQVLEELPARDVVSWSTLIGGYAQHGQSEHALECFHRMQSEGLIPNEVTFSLILKACGVVGALNEGEKIHEEITKRGLLQGNPVLVTALIEMYAKCGALGKAQMVIHELSSKDIISVSALVAGLANQGHSEHGLHHLQLMWHEGLLQDGITSAHTQEMYGSARVNQSGY
ncbi:hypothetical protein KP509_04G103900 [Ceratopteris richardii]|nr:hypothetical protein KP509_04G103900 [Ceratopteris richardii]